MRFYTQAKEAEARLDWENAAFWWDQMGERQHADACRMIHQANVKGDRWRALVKEYEKQMSFWQAARRADAEVYGH